MKMESVSLNPNSMDSATSLKKPEGLESSQPVASESLRVAEDSGTTSAVQMSGSDVEQQSKELANILQGQADRMNRNIAFSTYGEKEKTVIRVTEIETGKLIREIPPEEQQKLSAKIQEMLGTLIDTMS